MSATNALSGKLVLQRLRGRDETRSGHRMSSKRNEITHCTSQDVLFKLKLHRGHETSPVTLKVALTAAKLQR